MSIHDSTKHRTVSIEERLDGTQDPSIGDEITSDLSREGDTELPEFTMREVSMHSESRSCWIVLFDFVYDVTDFLHEVGIIVLAVAQTRYLETSHQQYLYV